MNTQVFRKAKLFLRCVIATTFILLSSRSTFGLSTDKEVGVAYVKEHPKEFSVEVTKNKNGLIDFTIKHLIDAPKYHVVHLAVYQQGKLVAENSTPLFSKNRDNEFYVSLAPSAIEETVFDISDGGFGVSGENAVPLPGTTTYRFKLLEFVPKTMLGSEASTPG